MAGLRKEILNDLTGLISNFIGNQRYIAIILSLINIHGNSMTLLTWEIRIKILYQWTLKMKT